MELNNTQGFQFPFETGIYAWLQSDPETECKISCIKVYYFFFS